MFSENINPCASLTVLYPLDKLISLYCMYGNLPTVLSFTMNIFFSIG